MHARASARASARAAAVGNPHAAASGLGEAGQSGRESLSALGAVCRRDFDKRVSAGDASSFAHAPGVPRNQRDCEEEQYGGAEHHGVGDHSERKEPVALRPSAVGGTLPISGRRVRRPGPAGVEADGKHPRTDAAGVFRIGHLAAKDAPHGFTHRRAERKSEPRSAKADRSAEGRIEGRNVDQRRHSVLTRDLGAWCGCDRLTGLCLPQGRWLRFSGFPEMHIRPCP